MGGDTYFESTTALFQLIKSISIRFNHFINLIRIFLSRILFRSNKKGYFANALGTKAKRPEGVIALNAMLGVYLLLSNLPPEMNGCTVKFSFNANWKRQALNLKTENILSRVQDCLKYRKNCECYPGFSLTVSH